MEIRRREGKTGTDEHTKAWALAYLDVAAKEGRKILDDDQYAHVVQQFEALATEQVPSMVAYADVKPIEDFFELRDKGGVLGQINLRVYFAIVGEQHTLVVLGCYKKEDEGKRDCPVSS